MTTYKKGIDLMKYRQAVAHMKAAYVYAELSYCERRQVGCVIVKNNSIIAVGYNGTASGDENCCEDADGNTLPKVVHAEDNALRKLTRNNQSAEGATVFVTTAPCELCAPRIIDAGVKRVYYGEIYRCAAVIQDLESKGIEVIHLPIKKQQ